MSASQVSDGFESSGHGNSLRKYVGQVENSIQSDTVAPFQSINRPWQQIYHATQACKTPVELRDWHERRSRLRRNNAELLQILSLGRICRKVYDNLHQVSKMVLQLKEYARQPARGLPEGYQTDLHLANQALKIISEAWKAFEEVWGLFELRQSRRALDLLKEYVVEVLRMTVSVGPLVAPEFAVPGGIWTEWYHNLHADPPLGRNFTFDTTFAGTQSLNPSRNYILPESFLPNNASSSSNFQSIAGGYTQPSGSGTQDEEYLNEFEDEQ